MLEIYGRPWKMNAAENCQHRADIWAKGRRWFGPEDSPVVRCWARTLSTRLGRPLKKSHARPMYILIRAEMKAPNRSSLVAEHPLLSRGKRRRSVEGEARSIAATDLYHSPSRDPINNLESSTWKWISLEEREPFGEGKILLCGR